MDPTSPSTELVVWSRDPVQNETSRFRLRAARTSAWRARPSSTSLTPALSVLSVSPLTVQVSGLSHLVSLKIRKNALAVIPPELFGLEHLSLLDLTGNAIRELPEGLGRAVALQVLLLAGEPPRVP